MLNPLKKILNIFLNFKSFRIPEIRSRYYYDHFYITPLNIRFYFYYFLTEVMHLMQHISAFLTLVSIFHATLNVFTHQTQFVTENSIYLDGYINYSVLSRE